MKKELFDLFPYAIIRLNENFEVTKFNRRAAELLPILNQEFRDNFQLLAANPWLALKSWVGTEGQILFPQMFRVDGSSDTLIAIGEEPDFITTLPSPFEQSLEDFTADPSVVIPKIANLVQSAATFERFDLIRVDPILRKYTYEYSIGIDIEGTLHTAYSPVRDSGLGWIVQSERPFLTEELDPSRSSFLEDPLLFQTGFRSVLRVPINFDHDVVGAILLASAKKGHFQIEDAMLLERISKSIAQSFYHSGILLQHDYQTAASATLLQTIVSTLPEHNISEYLDEYCTHLCQNSKMDRVGILQIDPKARKKRCLVEAGKQLGNVGEWVSIPETSGLAEMLSSNSTVAFNLGNRRFKAIEQDLASKGFTAILYVPIENNEGEVIAALTAITSDETALSLATAGLFKYASDQLGQILSKLSPELEPTLPKRQINSSLPKGFEHIIGSSKAIRNTIHTAAQAAKYEFPILITGETGTGKELFAKAIHESSNSAQGPFIVVNSAAIPTNLLESELFGYQEGAFTGGLKGGKKGKILLANGGTLFLDEIGELSPDLQAKLLRVIQEQEVEPLGATKPVPVNVRIISATHRNLPEMVKQGDFREDLLYRLNAIEINLPPLRERGEDVLELADHMLQFLSGSHTTPLKRLSSEAKQVFLKYPWPGNVRQLQNIINRLFVFVEGQVIQVIDLPPDTRNLQFGHDEPEKERLEKLLREFNGNKTALAHYLGITRTGLWKKLKRLGIQ